MQINDWVPRIGGTGRAVLAVNRTTRARVRSRGIYLYAWSAMPV